MNLKRWKIISILGIFGLSGIFHFVYEWIPNDLTCFLFPVNESIWEHNKIIILAFFVLALLEKIYYKDKKNTLRAGLISGVVCCLLVMLIFSPIYFFILKTRDNMIVTFAIFLLSITLSEYLNYKLLSKKANKKLEILALLGFIFLFVLNGILTYYPVKLPIFYDYSNKLYGIK